MNPIGERAARLAGEHVSKTNAVLGITRVLSVEASRGEGYGIAALNCLQKHASLVVFSSLASLAANSSPLSGRKDHQG